MFDENLHHPKWSFVRGWNVRECTCTKCTMVAWQRQPQPYVTYTEPPKPQITPYAPWNNIGIAPAQPYYTTIAGTTNVHK